jgi:hypothetical protein
MGHGASGMGHWASGMGHRALVMGHGAWGIGKKARAGHTSLRLRTAIDTRIFKEVWDLDLLFLYK